jgi:two-component system osmolarity sensor histidine kinase EnvZ
MQDMLEDYLAFAKGDGGEESAPTNLRELLQEVYDEGQYFGTPIELKLRKRREELVLPLKRQAFKRAITNLVSNAARFGDQIIIRGAVEGQWVRIEVDDNGPGIPEAERANVFKPFYRLDHARNQDEGNTGLGLAIARDIAKSHGGDITLGESSMGGLRAIISVPL